MSFSYEIKRELAKLPLADECCYLSELSALLRTSAEFKLQQNKFSIVLKTEILEVYEKINAIVEKLYGISLELELSEDESYFYNIRYEIKIEPPHAERILADCGILLFDEQHQMQFQSGIDKYMVMEPCCKKSYVRGAFIGSGTSSILFSDKESKTQKHSAGYHLEFVFMSEQLATDFCHLLSEFDILSKKVQRKNNFVVYLKEGEAISDLLVLMGANKAVFTLQNEIALRSIRNVVNRQNNCETGNITKLVNASLKQVQAIKTIQETIGLDELPLPLQEVAMLRLANQEESLDNLVMLSGTNLTKSGLRHRFTKIVEIANALSEKQ